MIYLEQLQGRQSQHIESRVSRCSVEQTGPAEYRINCNEEGKTDKRVTLGLIGERGVNPDHLFLGTDQDNANDKVAKRRHQFGERHHRAKLTNEQALAIRADRRSPLEIFRSGEYPVGYSLICMIKKGRIWKNVQA